MHSFYYEERRRSHNDGESKFWIHCPASITQSLAILLVLGAWVKRKRNQSAADNCQHAKRDENDFARQADYFGFNPVKHGLAED